MRRICLLMINSVFDSFQMQQLMYMILHIIIKSSRIIGTPIFHISMIVKKVCMNKEMNIKMQFHFSFFSVILP